MKDIPENSKCALVGIVFRPEGQQPWLVQDNRMALRNEFPCSTKGDVLDKIAAILDDMHLPPGKLDQDSDSVEVVVAVTLQVSLCDPGDEVNTLDLRRAASTAVENAVHHHEEVGFDHALADKISLHVRAVRPFGLEKELKS